jgi:hypothetical protein
VSQDDTWVTEVRLLQAVDTVGEVRGATPAAPGNPLIVGDPYEGLPSRQASTEAE